MKATFLHTFLSMICDGKPNSSIMHTGIAPPHGLALSNLRSNKVHSMFGFLAIASAAHEPDGPPPTTATLNFGVTVTTNDETIVKKR